MSDEIDIEEHDILNNPSIKSIFPDLSVVKREINEYYEEGNNGCADIALEKTVIKKELETPPSISNNVQVIGNNSKGADTQFQKVVIKEEVGTAQSINNIEPNVTRTSSRASTQLEKVVIKKELDTSTTANDIEPGDAKTSQSSEANNTAKTYFHENIIVLGSKPSVNCDNTDSKSTDKVAKLQLKKIDNFLSSCKRYCEKCLIVFPKKNLFNLHKINKHKKTDHLIKANRQHLHATAKPIESKDNSNKIIVGQHPQENESSELSCFHCKQIFPNKSCLIEHLYKVLEPNEITTDKHSTDSTTIDENNEEVHSNNQVVNESVDNVKTSDVKQSRTVKVKVKNNHTTNKSNRRILPQRIVQKRKIINTNNTDDHIRKKRCDTDDSCIEKEDELLYRCFVCSKYNITFKHYSRHVRTDHNIEPPKNVKKVAFDPKCRFCSSKLANMKYYNIHLYRSHKQQQKDVNFRPDKNIAKIKINFALKSVLFQCMKCKLFFLSSNVARNHSIHKSNNTKKCSKCQRLFNIEYMALHLNQHALSKTFTVHKVPESACNSILYKCSGCAVHFSEEKFLEHNAKCYSEPPNSSHCKICDILISSADMIDHNLNHKKYKMLYSDFIIIESEIMHNKEKDVQPQLANKKLKIFFCKNCHCFMVAMNNKSLIHVEGKCSHMKKAICKDCGLVMTVKAHFLHKQIHKNKFVSLYDYTFIDMKTKKQIIPPIPVYPKCDICGVHFLRYSAVKTHECEEQDSITCSICSIKLTEHAFKLHMRFHSYSKPNTIRSLEDAVSL